MRALVTGGGGFLGGCIVRMLLERGDRVRVLGRNSYPQLEKRGVECVVGDVRDSQAVNAALRNVEVVYHAAALAGIWGPGESYYSINSRGTANVIQGCLLNHVGRLVYTSSFSVVFNGRDIVGGEESLLYAERFNAPYPASKSVAEKMVLDANGWEFVVEDKRPQAAEINQRHGSTVRRLATCALRPHLIWGEGDPHLLPRVLQMARRGKLKCVGDGTNQVSLTFVDNAARAHLLAADCLTPDSALGGQAYFVSDREPVLLWDWINNFLRRMKVKPVETKVPFRLAYIRGAIEELTHRLLPRLGEPAMTRFLAEVMARSHSFSWARAKRDFGYEPTVDNETGLNRVVAALSK